jgi:hypothetical protein
MKKLMMIGSLMTIGVISCEQEQKNCYQDWQRIEKLNETINDNYDHDLFTKHFACENELRAIANKCKKAGNCEISKEFEEAFKRSIPINSEYEKFRIAEIQSEERRETKRICLQYAGTAIVEENRQVGLVVDNEALNAFKDYLKIHQLLHQFNYNPQKKDQIYEDEKHFCDCLDEVYQIEAKMAADCELNDFQQSEKFNQAFIAFAKAYIPYIKHQEMYIGSPEQSQIAGIFAKYQNHDGK